MTGIVLDASVALAWCFPDESSSYARSVLVQSQDQALLVPHLWAFEVAHGLAMGLRRGRLSELDYRHAIGMLKGLVIRETGASTFASMDALVSVSTRFQLSAYDAAYLELALRLHVPLATLDRGLAQAARTAGVAIAGEE